MKGRSRYMNRPNPAPLVNQKQTDMRRALDQKLSEWDAKEAAAKQQQNEEESVHAYNAEYDTVNEMNESEIEIERLFQEVEKLVTSGKAPTPSEVNKQLLREQRRVRDLSMWARDANVFEVFTVAGAFEDVSRQLRYCQILLDAKDPHALKLLEAVVVCNNTFSDAIIIAKNASAAALLVEKAFPTTPTEIPTAAPTTAPRAAPRAASRAAPRAAPRATATAATASSKTKKKQKFAFGKKVSNLGQGYGRTGWAYAHQNNQIKDGLTFVGDTAVSIKHNKTDTRPEHSHAKDMGNIEALAPVIARPDYKRPEHSNAKDIGRLDETDCVVSPKRPDDKIPRTERRKHAWGKNKDDTDDDNEADIDINNIIDAAMLDVSLDLKKNQQKNQLKNQQNNQEVEKEAIQKINSDLTIEIVRNIMGKQDSRSSSVAGTTGGSVVQQQDLSLRGSFESEVGYGGPEFEEPDDTETRYTDEWEVDSHNDDTHEMQTNNEQEEQEEQDYKLYLLQKIKEEQKEHGATKHDKPGFNNVLYHGNKDKTEAFTSPSKESQRRHPHDQKCSDKVTTKQLRQHLEEGGRSATWLTCRVQVADDGATWVSDSKYYPEKIKKNRSARWPASYAGTSSYQKNKVKNNFQIKDQHHRPSIFSGIVENKTVFKKTHGRAISSGNADFHYVNWLAQRNSESTYKMSTKIASPNGFKKQVWN